MLGVVLSERVVNVLASGYHTLLTECMHIKEMLAKRGQNGVQVRYTHSHSCQCNRLTQGRHLLFWKSEFADDTGFDIRSTFLIFTSTASMYIFPCTFVSDIVPSHYSDVIMDTMAPQITTFTIVYSTVYSGADQRKHQRSASRAFVRGIHWWPLNSPHK